MTVDCRPVSVLTSTVYRTGRGLQYSTSYCKSLVLPVLFPTFASQLHEYEWHHHCAYPQIWLLSKKCTSFLFLHTNYESLTSSILHLSFHLSLCYPPPCRYPTNRCRHPTNFPWSLFSWRKRSTLRDRATWMWRTRATCRTCLKCL
jgi:hypothetical protein